jgi:NADH:ubiquinone oxidoreductase subunit 6 (subunit J)
MTALLGFIAVLAAIVFGVSMLVVSVQVFRRRPPRRWGVMAIISFLVLIAVGVASPTNNAGPAKPGTTTARTEETTAQKTTARPQTANTTTNSGTTKGETTAAQTTAVTTS